MIYNNSDKNEQQQNNFEIQEKIKPKSTSFENQSKIQHEEN